MNDTPTTEQIRQQWTWNYPDYDNDVEQFDAWLTKVKEEVWDEGYVAGFLRATSSDEQHNPYKEVTE